MKDYIYSTQFLRWEFLVFYFGDLLSYVEEIGNEGGPAFEVFWTTKDITQEPDILKWKILHELHFFVKESEFTKVEAI